MENSIFLLIREPSAAVFEPIQAFTSLAAAQAAGSVLAAANGETQFMWELRLSHTEFSPSGGAWVFNYQKLDADDWYKNTMEIIEVTVSNLEVR